MFTIFGFGIFVALIVSLLIIPVWSTASAAIAWWGGKLHSDIVPEPTRTPRYGRASLFDDPTPVPNATEFKKSINLLLMKPIDSIIWFIGMRRDTTGDHNGWFIVAFLIGVILWCVTTIYGFIGFSAGSGFDRYGFTGSYIHWISITSEFFATYLSIPITVALGGLLLHALITRGGKKAYIHISRVNKAVDKIESQELTT